MSSMDDGTGAVPFHKYDCHGDKPFEQMQGKGAAHILRQTERPHARAAPYSTEGRSKRNPGGHQGMLRAVGTRAANVRGNTAEFGWLLRAPVCRRRH